VRSLQEPQRIFIALRASRAALAVMVQRAPARSSTSHRSAFFQPDAATIDYGAAKAWQLRQQWADPQRREQILFAARSVETEPSLIGFSHQLIAAATRP